MMISELIVKLEYARRQMGDLEVLIAHEDGDGDFGCMDVDADAVVFVPGRYCPKD